VAFADWLACAAAGASERAARSARGAADGLFGRVLAAGTAGHVLDFDDTYVPGLAHLSAPTAPAALVLGAELDACMGEVLEAYTEGFEAMGALARSSHPALYERGWHPTAVCGAVGAAVSAACLLGHSGDEVAGTAIRLALVQAGGLRRAFGSDAKAIQVGAASAAGVISARLADVGASATGDLGGDDGGESASPRSAGRAVRRRGRRC
jgi:2-methylcitrate dehydratase PrpD